MGADATYLFYGVRYQVSDPLELSQLQTGDHPLVKVATKTGLDTFWGNFGFNGEEFYLLYIGRQVAMLGNEDRETLNFLTPN